MKKQTARHLFLFSFFAFFCVASLGLFGNKKSDSKKETAIAEIEATHDEVLDMLKEADPKARKRVNKAEGYAVFSNVGVNVIIASFAGGHGMVVDNKSGEKTYMNMGSAGIGLGVGIKDFRAVFIFHDRDRMEDFVQYGWDFSGQADASVKSDEKGVSAGASGTAIPGVEIYQLTKTGLALQATLQGTKYWKAKALNE